MITIDSISITKERKKILDSISYVVKKNSCTAIIGTNGAGKTCLLQTIIGQIQADRWSVHIDTDSIGYCPDIPGINPYLTIQEQRSLTQRIAKKSRAKEQQQQRIHTLELNNQLKIPIKNLSQGNKQKVSIINSIIHNPDCIIRDEPTQHLDPHARQTIHALMIQLKQEGKTILYTTHFLEDMGVHTDTYIIMDKGRLVNQWEYLTTDSTIQQFFQNKTKD